MRPRTAVLLLCALAPAAYLAGSLHGKTTATKEAQSAARASPPPVPVLPSPQRLAALARSQLERLDPAVWHAPRTLEEDMALTSPGDGLPAAPAPPLHGLTDTPVASPGKADEPADADPASIRATMSQSLAAVMQTNGKIQLVLADRSTSVRQVLAVGDTYRAGWRVSAIATDKVTLKRNRMQIDVPVSFAAVARREPAFAAVRAHDALVPAPSPRPQFAENAPPAPRKRLTRRDASRPQE